MMDGKDSIESKSQETEKDANGPPKSAIDSSETKTISSESIACSSVAPSKSSIVQQCPSTSSSSVATTSSLPTRTQRTPSPPKRPGASPAGSSQSKSTAMDTDTTPAPENTTSGPSAKSQEAGNSLSTTSSASKVGDEKETKNSDSSNNGAKSNSSSTTATVKRPAPESRQETASDSTEAEGSVDAKRRKIKRDFKFESRSSPHTSTPTTTDSSTAHRVTYSTAGRGGGTRPVTVLSSTKPGKPTVTTNNSSSTEKASAGSSVASSPTDTGSEKTSSGKGNEPVETKALSPLAEDAGEEESTEAGSATGPKVPPIKIVLGANGNGNSGSIEAPESNSTSNTSVNSPNGSFPYVVSSTTSDNSVATTPNPTTTTAAPPAPSTAQSGKVEIRKEPTAKVKLVATIGPTGGTLTYTSSASSTASTTILTTTSTTATALSNSSSAPTAVKDETSSAGDAKVLNKTAADTLSSVGASLGPEISAPATTVASTSSSIPISASTDVSKAVSEPMDVDANNTCTGKESSNVVHDSSMKSEPEVAESASTNVACCTTKEGEKPPTPPSSSPSVTTSKEKEKESASEKTKGNTSRSSPVTVSSTTSAAVTISAPTVPAMPTTATTSSATGSEATLKEKPHRVTRSSHRKAEAGASVPGNGIAPSSPATNSPKTNASACSSPAQAEIQEVSAPLAGKSGGVEAPEKADSADSANTDLHPRKRKIRSKEKEVKEKETPASGGPSSSNSSTAGDPESEKPDIKPQSEQQPVLNCLEMFLKIRKQIEERRKNLFPVQPKPPQGFKDYLMNRATYVLAGNANARLAVPLLNTPANLPIQMKETFIEQEKDRHKLRLQHLVEKEKLVLSVEQEILRVHGRAARALSNQSLPFSVCTILKDQEVYNLLTPEQEEKDRNARSRYNGRLFLSWLQDIDDKWDKVKESMILRHHNEAESLFAVQKMDWEWKLKEVGICEPKATPIIEDLHVPMVHVSDDFDLLPA